MSFVGFKQPREKNNKHLDFIRQQPCCVCGGIDVEASHIRVGSPDHGKRATGMAEKPDDKWSLPLCNRHHREQHSMAEMAFWNRHGINPFFLAMKLSGR